MSYVQDAEVFSLKVKCRLYWSFTVCDNTCLWLLNFCFPGTGCQICDAGGQEELLSGSQDASPLPHPDWHVGQRQLLCTLLGSLPHHLAGVRAVYQSEEGGERFSESFLIESERFISMARAKAYTWLRPQLCMAKYVAPHAIKMCFVMCVSYRTWKWGAGWLFQCGHFFVHTSALIWTDTPTVV